MHRGWGPKSALMWKSLLADSNLTVLGTKNQSAAITLWSYLCTDCVFSTTNGEHAGEMHIKLLMGEGGATDAKRSRGSRCGS